MADQQQLAEAALAQSGLKVEKLSPEQRQEILNKISQRLAPPSDEGSAAAEGSLHLTENFSLNIGCIACEVGLNVLAAVPIGLMLAAGVAVAPEATAVLAIASFFEIAPVAVSTVINTALAAGGGTSVEGVIASLCESFGAC